MFFPQGLKYGSKITAWLVLLVLPRRISLA